MEDEEKEKVQIKTSSENALKQSSVGPWETASPLVGGNSKLASW